MVICGPPTLVSGSTDTVTSAARLVEILSDLGYQGTWTSLYRSFAYGSYIKYATATNAKAWLSFSGRSIAWVATKSATSGRAWIYVDGSYVQTVDLYSTTTYGKRVAFSKSWPTSGTHSLQVVVEGTSGRPAVDVDAFVVLR